MSRVLFVAFCFLLISIPAIAQDDYAQVQIGMGYGNLGLPVGDGTTSHRSGFAMQTGYNLSRWFGIDMNTGFYSLGNRTTLISNVFGGKLIGASVVGGRVVPYGVAGVGVAYATQGGSLGSRSYYSRSMTSTRLGVGVDVPLSDSLGVRFEGARMSIRSNGAWQPGWNIATGIYLNLVRH